MMQLLQYMQSTLHAMFLVLLISVMFSVCLFYKPTRMRLNMHLPGRPSVRPSGRPSLAMALALNRKKDNLRAVATLPPAQTHVHSC